MENRSELQDEYFEFIKTLNKTNRKKDQKTEIAFLIKTDSLNNRYLTATTNEEKYLRFGTINLNFQLRVDDDFRYQDFGEYIKISISGVKNESDLNSTIRLAISRLFAAV